MLWHLRPTTPPTVQATVSIGGATWDLYRGNIGWNVYSFVRTFNTTNSTLNLRDFLNNLSGRGWLSTSKYLISVGAGTEVSSAGAKWIPDLLRQRRLTPAAMLILWERSRIERPLPPSRVEPS